MLFRSMKRRGSLLALGSLTAAAFLVGPTAGAGAKPASQVAKTNKGGSCSLEAVAARAGGAITYGGRVTNCSTRFGIRNVGGRAILFEGINTAVLVDATPRETGGPPLEISQTYEGEAGEQYHARFGATVVIKGGKSMRRPKRPEKWKDPGRGCRVMSTHRAGDTLGCTLAVTLTP